MLTTSLCLVLTTSMAAAPQLSGRVTDERGRPVPDAAVAIIKAAPLSGTGTMAATAYPDCEKRIRTDHDGRFQIGELGENLKFQLLVSKLGMLPTKTDYLSTDEQNISLRLASINLNVPNNRKLTARVVDEQGDAIVGAQVYPFGGKTDRRRWWGPMPDLDQIAVTDDEGRFFMTSLSPMLGIDVKVYARGFVPLNSDLMELNGNEHVLRLQRGATVAGQIQWDGRPVMGHLLGIVQQDRGHKTFIRESRLVTAKDGAFRFNNLPPNQELVLYSYCDPNFPASVLKTTKFRTPKNGQEKDLGKISLVWGLSISGIVEAPAGFPIPKGSELRLSRDPAWDSVNVPIQDDGSFIATALPPEVYKISVRVRGMDVDSQKLNYQMLGQNRFGLRLRKDVSLSIPLVAQQ